MQQLGRIAKFWLILAFGGSAAYFGYFNRDRISVALPPWIDNVTVPAYAAYICFFMIGAFVTTAYLGMETFRRTMEVRKLRRRVLDLEAKQPLRSPESPSILRSPAIDPSIS